MCELTRYQSAAAFGFARNTPQYEPFILIFLMKEFIALSNLVCQRHFPKTLPVVTNENAVRISTNILVAC
jgi:hypothetical protein